MTSRTATFDRKAAGVVGTDDVSVASLTANFVDPNAGTWAVTVTGGTLAGNQAGNYAIAGSQRGRASGRD